MGIDVIVTCTKRKRYLPDEMLHFGSLPLNNANNLSSKWFLAVEHINQRYSTENVYLGGAWQLAKKTFISATKLSTTSNAPCCLRVLSAGFGLLETTDMIPSYEATFATGPNQVGSRIASGAPIIERHQDWWRAINQIRLGTPTPLTDKISGTNCCLLVASQDYIDAILPDLAQLASRRDPDQLAIVSVGTAVDRLPDALKPYFLPVDVHVEHLLKIPRTTINQGVANWLLSTVIPETGWSRRILEPAIRDAIRRASLDAPTREPGQRMTDDTILEWIREEYARSVRPTRAGLLQRFRRKGWACEQGRFSRLCRAVADTTGSSMTGSSGVKESVLTDGEQAVLSL